MEGGFTVYNLADVGSIFVVVAIVAQLKRYVQDRWVPLLPLVVSAPIAALVTLSQASGTEVWWALVVRSIWEALKIGTAASAGWKIVHTTVLDK